MPSANRILGAINGLRFNLVVVSSIHEELKRLTRLEPRAAQSRLPLARTLELKDVSYSYPDGSEVLDHVSLVIERGTSMGFIGTSGAGKSTLVDVVMGLLAPSSGAILVDDRDVRDNLRGWQDEIGYVPQTIFLTDDSLRRNIAFGLPSERIDEAAVQRALVAARLDDFVATLPEGLDTVVGERGVRLSGGQRQRIGIARALYHDPEVLVLDEATSALDTTTEQSVMDAIVALKNKTILIIAHRLSTVARCDLVVRLESGRIVERAPASEVLGEERSAVS